MGEYTSITSPDGSFAAYVARPGKTPAASIVVIQEIMGVNRTIRGVADDLAKQGFLAIAPDLFWRQQPGVDLDDRKPEEWQQAFKFYQGFDVMKGVADVSATIAAAKALPGASGKVGVVGFCLGGLLTFLSAARNEADAYVPYYGGGTDQHIAEGAKIKKPMLMHLAGADEYIGAEPQRIIKDGLKSNPLVEIHTYPGRGHAFTREGGAHYDAGDAEIANGRTYAFFRKHLG
jgi:carboxymethylenebutenolidase